MLRRLLPLKHRFDLPSRIMRHALDKRWTQFINLANYKIIDSNVMDWANVTKIQTSPSAKPFPPLMSMHCTKTISRPDQECIHVSQAPLGVSQLSRKFNTTSRTRHLWSPGRREEEKNSQHKFTMMVNSQLWRHMMLECHRFQTSVALNTPV